MNKKLKTKWLKALRGGQYKQTDSRLVSLAGDSFCCLGVLADIQGCLWKETQYGELYPMMPGGRTFNCSSDGAANGGEYLKPSRAGNLPLVDQKTLAEMNDNGQSFKQIADYIEANL